MVAPEIGVSIELFVIDLLHTLFLGIIKELAMTVVWELIEADAFHVGYGRTHDELVSASVECLCVKLFAFYNTWQQENPTEPLTHLKAFKPSMIGTRTKQCLRTKAAETKGFFFFLVELVGEFSGTLERGDVWHSCMCTLKDLVELLQNSPLMVNRETVQDQFEITKPMAIQI